MTIKQKQVDFIVPALPETVVDGQILQVGADGFVYHGKQGQWVRFLEIPDLPTAAELAAQDAAIAGKHGSTTVAVAFTPAAKDATQTISLTDAFSYPVGAFVNIPTAENAIYIAQVTAVLENNQRTVKVFQQGGTAEIPAGTIVTFGDGGFANPAGYVHRDESVTATPTTMHSAAQLAMPAMDDLPAESLAVRDGKYLHEGTTAQQKQGDLGVYKLQSRAVSDAAVIGTTELVTNGNFSAGATGWTASAGWVINTTNATLTVANGTGDLTSAATIPVIAGRTYQISWAQTNSATGSVFLTPKLGTASGVPIGASTSQVQVLVANTTGNVEIAFTPTSATSGTVSVDNVSVREITAWGAQYEFRDSAGVVYGEQRAGPTIVANGTAAGRTNTTGSNWVANGAYAGVANTTGSNWVANGAYAGVSNTTGSNWVANGAYAGFANTTGSNWVAVGAYAGRSNTTGSSWVANGNNVGFSNTTGSNWVASGNSAGFSNTTGGDWVASGNNAGASNTTGSNWVAIGAGALRAMGGNILTLTPTAGGTGYTTATAIVSGGGSSVGAAFNGVIAGGAVQSWTRLSAGAGFDASTAPIVVTILGNGTGAAASAGTPVNTGQNNFAVGASAGYRNSETTDIRIDSNCGFIGNLTGRDSTVVGVDIAITYSMAIGCNALVGGSNTIVLGAAKGSTGEVKLVVGATNSTAETGSVVATGAVVMGTKTVAQLSALTGVPTGALYWASNGRAYVNTAGAIYLQGAGAGTGVAAQYNGTSFVIPGTTTAVVA